MAQAKPALRFRAVSKTYRSRSGREVTALREASFSVASGSVISIRGRSGSGKSTLLHLAAGIERPSRGEIQLSGQNLSQLSDQRRSQLRRRKIGFVFQFFHLLSHLTIEENILLPALIAGNDIPALRERLQELLRQVELEDRARDSVEELSGGEMQRVAICRALILSPKLLLADEPSGSLDDRNARMTMELMLELSRTQGTTLIYVTHSHELAALAGEGWQIHSGHLETP